MRKYLSTLHEKPAGHKKRFALLTSGAITLFIFGVWSLATFGMNGIGINKEIFTRKDDVPTPSVRVENEVSPLGSLYKSLVASVGTLLDSFGELKTSLETGLERVDLEAEYKKVEMGTLEIYGE